MTQRTQVAYQLAAYFEHKGHILSVTEYQKETDVPIRLAVVKRVFGSWNRMENIVRTINARNIRPADYKPATDIDDVIRLAAEKQADYMEKMFEASENIDAKTVREATARAQVENDALRAATPEGVLLNKMRKGGISNQDAKARQEAVEAAVAHEHAMLAKTPEGAALGKKLLGGVEDNDEKTVAIEQQNAQREKTAILAATAEGAAEAKLMEDDTDGQLTREAQARIRNELRVFVPPVTEDTLAAAEANALKLVRDETRDAVKAAASSESIGTNPVEAVADALAKANVSDTVELTDELAKTMPPADQPVADEKPKAVAAKAPAKTATTAAKK